MTSFLQSQDWAEFQKSIGRKVFQVGETYVIKHELPFGKNYLYVPYADAVPDLRELAKQEKSIFVKVEPLHDELAQALIHQGYRKSIKTIQPHKTVVLDLTKSEDELLSAMHYKTRYNIRVAEKHGIEIKKSDDIEIFWNLMQKTTERDNFHSHPKSYYEKLLSLCELWIAYKDTVPIAGAMILKHEDKGYYLHGASDHTFRSLMAPYALHWSIIRNLKLEIGNLRIYDLWGIDSARWPGVTRFKLGWGGRTVEYPGAFDLTISKPWHLAYTLYQYAHAKSQN